MSVEVFKDTPEIILGLVLVIVTTYATMSGLEVISRTFIVVWPVILTLFSIALLITLPHIRLANMLPFGETSFLNLLKSSIIGFAWTGEVILLGMLFPYIKSPRAALIAGNTANLAITFFITLTIIFDISVLGVVGVEESAFSFFRLIEETGFASYSGALVLVWIIAFFGKVAILQYVVTHGLAQLMNIKEYKTLAMPIAVLILILAIVSYKNSAELFTSVTQLFTVFILFEYIISSFLLFIAVIKKNLWSK